MYRLLMPSQIFFGEHILSNHQQAMKSLGSNCLIVTGAHSAKLSGALEEAQASLAELGIAYKNYDRISENPSVESIIEGASIAQKNNCDMVMGIGGGSPIDAAKSIALAAANELSVETIFDASKYKHCLSIIAIPTTSGTGTEATQYSVLTDTKRNIKAGVRHDKIFPNLSYCDPRYTLSLPAKVSLNTSLDALSHLLEGIFSKKHNPLVQPFIHEGIGMIIEHLPKVLANPGHLPSREKLMQASLYGGIVISQVGTTLQHAIGYPLTVAFNTPHGKANALVMKAVIDLFYDACQARFQSLFNQLNMAKIDFYRWLDAFELKLEAPLDSDSIERFIPDVMNAANMANNPITVTTSDVKAIYAKLN